VNEYLSLLLLALCILKLSSRVTTTEDNTQNDELMLRIDTHSRNNVHNYNASTGIQEIRSDKPTGRPTRKIGLSLPLMKLFNDNEISTL